MSGFANESEFANFLANSANLSAAVDNGEDIEKIRKLAAETKASHDTYVAANINYVPGPSKIDPQIVKKKLAKKQ